MLWWVAQLRRPLQLVPCFRTGPTRTVQTAATSCARLPLSCVPLAPQRTLEIRPCTHAGFGSMHACSRNDIRSNQFRQTVERGERPRGRS